MLFPYPGIKAGSGPHRPVPLAGLARALCLCPIQNPLSANTQPHQHLKSHKMCPCWVSGVSAVRWRGAGWRSWAPALPWGGCCLGLLPSRLQTKEKSEQNPLLSPTTSPSGATGGDSQLDASPEAGGRPQLKTRGLFLHQR